MHMTVDSNEPVLEIGVTEQSSPRIIPLEVSELHKEYIERDSFFLVKENADTLLDILDKIHRCNGETNFRQILEFANDRIGLIRRIQIHKDLCVERLDTKSTESHFHYHFPTLKQSD